MPPTEPQPRMPWARFAGMGVEFAASLVVFMLVGYWVDYHWRIEKHWGTLIGTLLGLIGGTYNFIREAARMLKMVQAQRPPGRTSQAPTRPDETTSRDNSAQPSDNRPAEPNSDERNEVE